MEWLFFAALWAAYWAFGLWLRQQISFEPDGELHGFDYNGHGDLFASTGRLIRFMRFRHPLFGFFLYPIALVGEPLAQQSTWLYWGYLCAVFSAVVTACVWMVWRLCTAICGDRFRGALCAILFAGFGYVAYLAACPESFSISMLLSLGVLAWGMRDRTEGAETAEEKRDLVMLDRIVWGALFFLSAGVTITQGAKVALAYLATHRLTRKEGWVLGISTAGLVAAGVLFYVAKLVWFGNGGYTIGDALAYNFGFIVRGVGWRERLRMLEMFFFEPVIPHGAPYHEFRIPSGYRTIVPYLACAALYVLAGIGGWRMRRTRLFRVMAAGFSVDVLIHLVCFWGMEEGQIYCGHWFHLLPLLVGGALAPRRPLQNGRGS
jgi:hypothetical protein